MNKIQLRSLILIAFMISVLSLPADEPEKYLKITGGIEAEELLPGKTYIFKSKLAIKSNQKDIQGEDRHRKNIRRRKSS